MQNEIGAALEPLVEQFESLGVRYQIGGSVASSVHGLPRTTIDVDLVAELRSEHVQPLVDAQRSTVDTLDPSSEARQWAEDLGIDDLLARALREAGLDP